MNSHINVTMIFEFNVFVGPQNSVSQAFITKRPSSAAVSRSGAILAQRLRSGLNGHVARSRCNTSQGPVASQASRPRRLSTVSSTVIAACTLLVCPVFARLARVGGEKVNA